MDFISRDQLVAGMNAWVLEKSKPLGHILVEQKVLRVDLHAALHTMVEKHLEVHGQDAAKSLAALTVPSLLPPTSVASIPWRLDGAWPNMALRPPGLSRSVSCPGKCGPFDAPFSGRAWSCLADLGERAAR